MGIEIEALRKRVLVNRFEKVMNPESPLTIHDQISLRNKICIWRGLASNAEEKWLGKIKSAFDLVCPALTPTERVDNYQMVQTLFEDNREDFLASNIEETKLSVRKVFIQEAAPAMDIAERARQSVMLAAASVHETPRRVLN